MDSSKSCQPHHISLAIQNRPPIWNDTSLTTPSPERVASNTIAQFLKELFFGPRPVEIVQPKKYVPRPHSPTSEHDNACFRRLFKKTFKSNPSEITPNTKFLLHAPGYKERSPLVKLAPNRRLSSQAIHTPKSTYNTHSLGVLDICLPAAEKPAIPSRSLKPLRRNHLIPSVQQVAAERQQASQITSYKQSSIIAVEGRAEVKLLDSPSIFEEEPVSLDVTVATSAERDVMPTNQIPIHSPIVPRESVVLINTPFAGTDIVVEQDTGLTKNQAVDLQDKTEGVFEELRYEVVENVPTASAGAPAASEQSHCGTVEDAGQDKTASENQVQVALPALDNVNCQPSLEETQTPYCGVSPIFSSASSDCASVSDSSSSSASAASFLASGCSRYEVGRLSTESDSIFEDDIVVVDVPADSHDSLSVVDISIVDMIDDVVAFYDPLSLPLKKLHTVYRWTLLADRLIEMTTNPSRKSSHASEQDSEDIFDTTPDEVAFKSDFDWDCDRSSHSSGYPSAVENHGVYGCPIVNRSSRPLFPPPSVPLPPTPKMPTNEKRIASTNFQPSVLAAEWHDLSSTVSLAKKASTKHPNRHEKRCGARFDISIPLPVPTPVSLLAIAPVLCSSSVNTGDNNANSRTFKDTKSQGTNQWNTSAHGDQPLFKSTSEVSLSSGSNQHPPFTTDEPSSVGGGGCEMGRRMLYPAELRPTLRPLFLPQHILKRELSHGFPLARKPGPAF